MAHNILTGFFWYLLVLISNSLKIGPQKPQIWPKMAISLF